jgi:tryptophan synthase alpha subunit
MNKLMTHVVVGYPDMETTKKLLHHMIEAKVDSIELQIPFSDPLADGPKLMAANDIAVNNGVSVQETLDAIKEIGASNTKIFIMSYMQPIISFGPEKFLRKAEEAGCEGYILPDLPFDAPEMDGFIKIDKTLRHKIIPVLSPGMLNHRLKSIFNKLNPETVYITARSGITGDHTNEYSNELKQLIKDVKELSDAKLAVGFGIQTVEDVQNVLKIADLAVVGSAVTEELGGSLVRATALVDKLADAAS